MMDAPQLTVDIHRYEANGQQILDGFTFRLAVANAGTFEAHFGNLDECSAANWAVLIDSARRGEHACISIGPHATIGTKDGNVWFECEDADESLVPAQ